jgi:hypothetical protein
MTTTTVRYTLEQIEDIVFKGFEYKLPDKVIEKISNLAMQVGSPDYVKTPVFKRRENPMKIEPTSITTNANANANTNAKDYGKKRKGNKGMEVLNDEDWGESVKPFQTTKIESKTGIDADFDLIRASINKMTDKNYIDMRNKINEVIEKLVEEKRELGGIGANIFEIASSNRYYSKIYAELYADLSSKFEFIKCEFKENFKKFTDLFNNIEYVDPNKNYDKFCEINKINERRKSLATFYINLMYCGIISKSEIIQITRNLLETINEYISLENKKNEVDELTEIVAILYKKDLYETDNACEKIDGLDINEIVEKLANSKVKDYKSFTNKTLFKFMDLIDM